MAKLIQKEVEGLLNDFNTLFKRYGINGIIDIPSYGTICFFTSEGGRLCVLEQAKKELEANNKVIDVKSSQYANERLQIQDCQINTDKQKSYIN